MIRWIVAGIVCVILLLVFFNSSTSQTLKQIETGVIDWFDSVAGAPESRELNLLRERFLHNNLSLQTHQTDYIFEITSSKQALSNYYRRYCVNNDANPFIFGANKKKLCEQIKQADLI